MKLHQVIALVAGRKSRAQKLLTEAHHGWNETAISGMTRSYTPKDDDGQNLPTENKEIHVRVADKIEEVVGKLTDFYDIVCTQEQSNTIASAAIEVEGCSLGKLPVPAILFLERQLVDLHAFVKKLPTLPPDREWSWDGNKNCHCTKPIETLKTNKVPDVLVKYAATKEHPAQTEAYTKDVVVGTYTTVLTSSAVPEQDKAAMLQRVENLQDAAKLARESANSVEASEEKVGAAILDYVFG